MSEVTKASLNQRLWDIERELLHISEEARKLSKEEANLICCGIGNIETYAERLWNELYDHIYGEKR